MLGEKSSPLPPVAGCGGGVADVSRWTLSGASVPRSIPATLRDLGIQSIFRETFPSSVEMARLALLKLGMSPSVTERTVSLFARHDEEQLEAQYAVHHDEAALIQTSQQASAQLQDLFESDGLAPDVGKAEEDGKT